MFHLRIGDKTLESLKDFEGVQDFQEEWAQLAIHFCKAWLEGQEVFELQTSGSTGKPKLIQVRKEQMIASALGTKEFLGTSEDTRILNCLHPGYVAGKMNLVRALVWDCGICCEAPSNQPITIDSERFHADFITLVPMQVSQLLQQPDKTKALKHILIGGAPLSEKLHRDIASSNLPAWQTYGMTETLSHIALAKINTHALVYQTLPNVHIGQNELGCLWLKSPMSGDEIIRTTDCIELKSKNTFIWKGRQDFVINSGGIKLHPEQLEQKMESIIQDFFPNSSFYLTGIQDEKLGEKMILLIETQDQKQKVKTSLKESMESFLDKYEIPKDIYFIDEFTKTSSGKLDRKATLGKVRLI